MLSQIQRPFLFIYYFFYNLLKGKEEWKCDNDAEKKPTKACCTPVQHAFENNQQLNLKDSKNNFLSTPRPYVDPLKKSWWQWTKDCVTYGWQKFKNAFNFRNTRYSTTFGKWLKFIPTQLWRGIKWIFYLILSGLLWILQAFMQIFRSQEATKTEEIPKQYVYKKIESPRDYLNNDVGNYYSESSFFEENKKDEKVDDEKEVEKNLKNDAKDESTTTFHNIQKAPKEAIISPPQVAAAGSAFSHGQITAPESHEHQESPISFYARRISVTSLKSGEQQQQTIPGFSSPPPPAPPPPPKSAIRIPTTSTATTTTTNNETTKESKEKALEASIKGGVSVIVPGLMDAAKESIERRKRGRTLSPENKNKIINSGPTPYRSPSVFGTSSSATNNTTNRTTATNHGVVTRMNTQTPTSDTFLFRPRSQTARNIETTTQKTSEDFFHPDNRQFQHQQQQRMFSTSPTPSGTFLLGQSVFKPVNEVEKIRDNFNRKCESRGASVAGGGYSRSPSVMSQSYHDGTRDSYTPYRDNTSYESSGIRNRFPMQSVVASNDYPTHYGQTTHKWNIRNNATSDDIFNRLPTGATRRVNELKVTEKHIEKDVDGQVLSGWREQNWMGTYEQFENPNPML